MSPASRPRRLRQTEALRSLVRETVLRPEALIAPFFVVHGNRFRRLIPSMPGQFQLSVDELLREAEKVQKAGILSVLLFGIPEEKDTRGSEAYDSNGITQQAVRALKKRFPKLVVFSDLCFCEYTDHGHCGIIRETKSGSWDVDNDATLKLIERTAVIQAEAGADFVSPSGMMDGAVGAIRAALDKAGLSSTGIMAYSAKYASSFYGPFRDAVKSAPQFGGRQTYQMDPGNIREALHEIREDVRQGADMVMVKPALSYLDVIAKIRPELSVPLVAYNVSGEYAMVKAAAEKGWVGRKGDATVGLEILTSIKRAGADLIISYHALEVASLLKRG